MCRLRQGRLSLGKLVVEDGELGGDLDDASPLEMPENAHAGNLEHVSHLARRESRERMESEPAHAVHLVRVDSVRTT